MDDMTPLNIIATSPESVKYRPIAAGDGNYPALSIVALS
jgi:hypothetical protein